MLTAVTRNLACRASGEAWLRSRLGDHRTPDVVFVQECPQRLLTDPPAGYQLVAGRTSERAAQGRTSALLVRDGLGPVTRPAEPSGVDGLYPFASMGTYVATATLDRPGGRVWLVPAHASPPR